EVRGQDARRDLHAHPAPPNERTSHDATAESKRPDAPDPVTRPEQPGAAPAGLVAGRRTWRPCRAGAATAARAGPGRAAGTPRTAAGHRLAPHVPAPSPNGRRRWSR